nr:Holliday junction branch migration protein RuvA [Marinicella sp. W31]MDC2877945.1 helix-hairpin-helix domain-containing protein [Marinicella sp. W31]
MALAILSTLTAGEISNAIALGDKTAVSRAPGVGPKVATRIVTELKNKVPAGLSMSDSEGIAFRQDVGEGTAPAAVSDAISALTNLGYSRDQAAGAVSAALKKAGEGPTAQFLSVWG